VRPRLLPWTQKTRGLQWYSLNFYPGSFQKLWTKSVTGGIAKSLLGLLHGLGGSHRKLFAKKKGFFPERVAVLWGRVPFWHTCMFGFSYWAFLTVSKIFGDHVMVRKEAIISWGQMGLFLVLEKGGRCFSLFPCVFVFFCVIVFLGNFSKRGNWLQLGRSFFKGGGEKQHQALETGGGVVAGKQGFWQGGTPPGPWRAGLYRVYFSQG